MLCDKTLNFFQEIMMRLVKMGEVIWSVHFLNSFKSAQNSFFFCFFFSYIYHGHYVPGVEVPVFIINST